MLFYIWEDARIWTFFWRYLTIWRPALLIISPLSTEYLTPDLHQELLSGDAEGPQLQWRGRLCCSFTQSWLTLQLHGIQHNRLPISISWILLRLMSTEFVMPSNHLILCHPLLLLPSICLSIRVFSNESVLHIHVAKVLELQHRSFQWIFRADFL